MEIYPIRYQDSVDLQGDDDNIITLLNPPEQRMLQSILDNVLQNPDVFIADYFEQDTDEVDSFLSDLMLKLMSYTLSEIIPETRLRLHADGHNTLVGTLTWTSLTTFYNAGFYVLSVAQNNLVGWSFVSLKKGKYQVEVLGRKNSAQGIISIVIDGTTVTTIDMYNAVSLDNQKVLSSDFTLTEDGVHSISAKMATKNASSSNYGLIFQWLDFYRISEI